MTYIRDFVYHALEHHYKELKEKHVKPRYMYELINEEMEKGLITATLEYSGFHLGNTAEILGISPATLNKKIKKHDIFVLNFS